MVLTQEQQSVLSRLDERSRSKLITKLQQKINAGIGTEKTGEALNFLSPTRKSRLSAMEERQQLGERNKPLGLGQRLIEGIKETPQRISANLDFQLGKEILKETGEQTKKGLTPKTAIGAIGGTVIAGAAAGAEALRPFGEATGEFLGGAISKLIPSPVKQFATRQLQRPSVQRGLGTLNRKFEEFPEPAKVGLRTAGRTAEVLTAGEGAALIKQPLGAGLKQIPKLKKPLGKIGEAITPRIPKGLKDKASRVAEQITASVQNLNPSNIKKFRRLTKTKDLPGGKAPEQYLLEKNIVGTKENTVKELTKRWSGVKDSFDSAVSKMQGTVQNKAVKTILDEIVEKTIKVEDKANKGIFTRLVKKHNTQGLTPQELVQARRFYENNVKLGYLKENASETVERTTNRLNKFRDVLVDEADKQGLKNVRKIGKEIQLAKTLADDIGARIDTTRKNNLFGLTDNVLLAGGISAGLTPQALLFLGIKKAGSSEKIKSFIAKGLRKISGQKTQGVPQINLRRVELKQRQRELLEKIKDKKLTKGIKEKAKQDFISSLTKKQTQLLLPKPTGKSVSAKEIDLKPIRLRGEQKSIGEKTNILIPKKK